MISGINFYQKSAIPIYLNPVRTGFITIENIPEGALQVQIIDQYGRKNSSSKSNVTKTNSM
jgi:hypothetical protein